jgi:hypothetical protein
MMSATRPVYKRFDWIKVAQGEEKLKSLRGKEKH